VSCPDSDRACDLSRITFESGRDGNGEIYVMDANGENQTRLTNDAAIDENPAFSPDGAAIAFESNRDGDFEIYVMTSTDGTGPVKVTQNPAIDLFPDWK
jgi:Tol biopolymer transport system component